MTETNTQSSRTPEQEQQAQEVLSRYARVVLELYDYFKANPEVYSEFKELCAKHPDRCIKIIRSNIISKQK
jgi:hypothetical protein